MTATIRRETRQKQEVRAALSQSGGFVSAQQLHSRLRARGTGIGLATVYRSLNDMVRNEEADSLHTSTGEQLFHACGAGHHHHLICTECGTANEIHAPLESWVDAVAHKHGFTQVRHVVDLFGVCADCHTD